MLVMGQTLAAGYDSSGRHAARRRAAPEGRDTLFHTVVHSCAQPALRTPQNRRSALAPLWISGGRPMPRGTVTR